MNTTLIAITVNQAKTKKVARFLALAIANAVGDDTLNVDSEDVYVDGTHMVKHWGELFADNGKVCDSLIQSIIDGFKEKAQKKIIKELAKYKYNGNTPLFIFVYND
jgi:hypothetical protein